MRPIGFSGEFRYTVVPNDSAAAPVAAAGSAAIALPDSFEARPVDRPEWLAGLKRSVTDLPVNIRWEQRPYQERQRDYRMDDVLVTHDTAGRGIRLQRYTPLKGRISQHISDGDFAWLLQEVVDAVDTGTRLPNRLEPETGQWGWLVTPEAWAAYSLKLAQDNQAKLAEGRRG